MSYGKKSSRRSVGPRPENPRIRPGKGTKVKSGVAQKNVSKKGGKATKRSGRSSKMRTRGKANTRMDY